MVEVSRDPRKKVLHQHAVVGLLRQVHSPTAAPAGPDGEHCVCRHVCPGAVPNTMEGRCSPSRLCQIRSCSHKRVRVRPIVIACLTARCTDSVAELRPTANCCGSTAMHGARTQEGCKSKSLRVHPTLNGLCARVAGLDERSTRRQSYCPPPHVVRRVCQDTVAECCECFEEWFVVESHSEVFTSPSRPVFPTDLDSSAECCRQECQLESGVVRMRFS